MFSVYVHIAPNNKKYFGITCVSVDSRWRNDGIGYKSQQLFWRAIQKYGWDNFQHIILVENLSKEWACQLERDLIWKYQSNNPKYGYNVSEGGNGPFGVTRSAETREKIRQANLGNKHSEETKRKIKENHAHYNKGRRFHFTDEQREILYASRRGKPAWNSGKKLSAEYRQKLSEAHKGQKAWNKGIPCSEAVKKRVSEANKGRVPWCKGKTLSTETKKQISESLKNRIWVNNGEHRTLIPIADLSKYLDKGYIRGRGHKTHN